jgi:transposase
MEAAIHTAHIVRDYFESQNIEILEWPPHSPDINIIEHIWHYLKDEIYKLPAANSKNNLWSNVELVMDQIWSSKTTAKINKLYDSLPQRMKAVIAAHGGNISY